MKKRLITILLAMAMVIGSVVTSFAVSSFTDITDERTASAAEVLKLMGVVSGTGDGKFNPSGILTRAEFCKLAVVSMHTDADFNKYANMTIFPDVKAGQWFAPYVNMAARGLKIVTGCPDGTFKPGNTITCGEAVTLLLRLVGYNDEEIGGVWPYGYMSFAESSGLLSGISAKTASDTMTRSDAAKLFVNTITLDAQGKRTMFSLSDETVLKSINVGTKTLTTANGQKYQTVKSVSSSELVGKTGYVVTRTTDNKALTFIPKSVMDGSGDVAVIIQKNGDKTALDALAGRTDYSIYKNGTKITAEQLKQNDIATYRSDENRVMVCDTKISVLYENCTTSPEAPSSIKALGGLEFEVLSFAQSTLSKYKPGSYLSLYLSADGRIAAAGSYNYSTSQNNGIFIVDQNGKADLICGSEVLDLNLNAGLKLAGRAVKISYVSRVDSSSNNSEVSFEALSAASYGTLKKDEGKLGNKKIAENVLVFENGEETGLKELAGSRVTYARENANGEIDLIVVSDAISGKTVAGKAEISTSGDSDGFGSQRYHSLTLYNAENPGGSNKETTFYEDGTYYVVAKDNGQKYVDVKLLRLVQTVEKTAIISDSLVNTQSGTMSVYKDVACYNQDTREWTSLSDALVYGTDFTLYALDGMVYVITYSFMYD